MKKSKKLVIRKTTIRKLNNNELTDVAGGLSGVRCTQSSCNSAACSADAICSGSDFVLCG